MTFDELPSTFNHVYPQVHINNNEVWRLLEEFPGFSKGNCIGWGAKSVIFLYDW